MIVAGCDVGSVTIKAVIMNDGSVISYHIIETGFKPDLAAKDAVDEALSKAHLTFDDIEYCVSTGDGRKNASFADKDISQLPCLSKGTYFFIPSVRVVVDVGGNTTKAIRVSKVGKILGYRLNDKCAAGSGRFFDILAEALELRLEDLGSLSLQSKSPLEITSQCVVFAESEVVSLINDGNDMADIMAGVSQSVASRIASLVKSLSVEKDVVMTGGVAKNISVIRELEKYLGVSIKTVSTDPQIVGAVGAALFAQEALKARVPI